MSDAMTVANLRAALANLPDDLPVVLSQDPEGNGFDTLFQVEPARWWPDDQELVDVDEDGEEAGVACVVLWP